MAMTKTIEKMLARAATLETQAMGLRLGAALLAEETHAGKRETAAVTIDQAIALRRAQKNGHSAAPTATRGVSPRQRLQATRDKKRDQIVAIVKAYGKPMPIAELAEAARAQGIPSLTGISGYSPEYLRKSGAKGKSRYAFVSRSAE